MKGPKEIKRVAVVGTGIMGAPIARHLMDAGFDVTVTTRTRDKARDLVNAGAHWADTPALAAAGADCVLTMVGTPEDVEEVYLGTGGLLGSAAPGLWMVDLTSSMPDLAEELSNAAESMDCHAFDCPVTGGQAGAESGTLTLMAGTTPEKAAPVLPVLNAFAEKIVFFGKPGAGQAAKLCNQLSLAGAMLGMAEAVAFARAYGLDEQAMLELVESGMGDSRALRDLGPKAVDADWKPGFKVTHFAKDLNDAIMTADDLGLALPGATTAHTLYATLDAIGGGQLGTQALEVLYEPEEDAVKAGLDWSQAPVEAPEEAANDHGDDFQRAEDSADACGCGHDHHDHDHCCGDDHCGCGH